MKYKVIKFNKIIISMVLIMSLGFVGALTITNKAVNANAKVKKLPIYCVDRKDKKIAITFDAAWVADDTDKIIEILKKHNAKATFFVVGEWAEKNPDSLKKFYLSGHEIGNHSDTHPSFSNISREKIQKEILSCNNKIEAITKEKVKLVRAPSGDYDNKSIEVCENLNMKMIQWSVDSLDWKKLSSDEIFERIIKKTEGGSILLFHTGVQNTPEALEKILTELDKNNFEYVKVSDLIYQDKYYIDFSGKQKLK